MRSGVLGRCYARIPPGFLPRKGSVVNLGIVLINTLAVVLATVVGARYLHDRFDRLEDRLARLEDRIEFMRSDLMAQLRTMPSEGGATGSSLFVAGPL